MNCIAIADGKLWETNTKYLDQMEILFYCQQMDLVNLMYLLVIELVNMVVIGLRQLLMGIMKMVWAFTLVKIIISHGNLKKKLEGLCG